MVRLGYADSLLREVVRRRLGLKKVRRRKEPQIRRAAEIALIYWRLFGRIDWGDGELRARAG